MILKIAIQTFRKNKFFSILNIVGLATGMTVFLLISQYVRFETTYEDFNANAPLIYRVTLQSYVNKELTVASAENYPGVGPALTAALPEVTGYTRLYNLGYKNNVIITNEDAQPTPIAFKQRRFLYADSAFLPMMGYKLVEGNLHSALTESHTAVITQEYARLYFGSQNPIGKTLRMKDDDNNDELVKITGVINEAPVNTHLKFDVLFSYKTLFARQGETPDYAFQRYDRTWDRKDMYTFIRVSPGTDARELEAKLPAIVNRSNPKLKEYNQNDILSLQPLKDIHLTSHLAEEPEPSGDASIVGFLSIIGVFVLIVAWINYVNLSTAKSLERAKEVGIRKVLGVQKHQLIFQFLGEAGVLNLLALLLALGLTYFLLPYFNSLSGLSLTPGYLTAPWFLVLSSLLWIIGTLLSGFYPAIVLSSFKPSLILKGKLMNSKGGNLLRKSLVVFQFVASVSLISGTVIVFEQLNYMRKSNIGMDISRVLVVERPGIAPRTREAFTSSIDVFRNKVMTSRAIESVTASSTVPGKQREFKEGIKKFGGSDDQIVTVRINSMDYDFVKTFDMKVLAGRPFTETFSSDADNSVMITASAVKLLGFKSATEAIGQTIAIPDWEWNPIIVGVVNDYHQVSLKKSLEPTMFYFTKYDGEFYSMRIKAGQDMPDVIGHIKQSWEAAFPGNPFEYFFLDEYFDRQYKNERQFGELFSTFAVLALIIGSLGLFGLSAYSAVQRTKEIGIRKVLGASERSAFMLLLKDYLKLIALSIVLAVPTVYMLMSNWIESFTYRITIGASPFFIASLVVLLVSLLTVSFQTLRVSRSNPVNALRIE